jgi:hypothetical protein
MSFLTVVSWKMAFVVERAVTVEIGDLWQCKEVNKK